MTKQDVLRRNLAHLGIILCHLSILGFVLMLGGVLSVIFSALAIILGFLVIIVTLGTIFSIAPDYFDKLTNITKGGSAVMEAFVEAAPIIGVISIVCCVASIVLTSFDTKWGKAKTRLIVSSVMLCLIVVAFVALLIGAGSGAK